MTARHGMRLIQHSAYLHVVKVLGDLGWTATNKADRPFGCGTVTVSEDLVGLEGVDSQRVQLVGKVDPTVTVGIMDTLNDSTIELGGPAMDTIYHLVVATFAMPPSVSCALSEDISDALGGKSRAPVIPFYDVRSTTQGQFIPNEWLEVEHVSFSRAKPGRPDWYIVQADIVRHHSASWTF